MELFHVRNDILPRDCVLCFLPMILIRSVSNSINAQFIQDFHSFMGDVNLVTNDPMEAHYIGWKMWVAAVSQAGTTDIDAVRQAMYGQQVASPSGYNVTMGTNHHLAKARNVPNSILYCLFNFSSL
jgi:ABC-type branched-subunit amino acid transport system substrate-binding protein